MASLGSKAPLALPALLVNKVPLELLVLLVPEVPLDLLVLLAKMGSTAFPVPSAPLVPVVALAMLVLLAPLDPLDLQAPLVLPAAVSTSASCPSHLKRRPMMAAATTGPMMPTWSATVTWRLTPPSRA